MEDIILKELEKISKKYSLPIEDCAEFLLEIIREKKKERNI